MTKIEVYTHPPLSDGRVFYGVRQTYPDGSSTTWNTGADRADAERLYAEIMAAPRCLECGDPQAGKWDKQTTAQMAERQLCFTCNAWTNRQREDASRPERVAIINGYHFTISPDQPRGYQGFLGHGGRRFDIRFHDGRDVVTHNLWAQGLIPGHFRDRMPDNAVFVQREEVGYVGPSGTGGGYVGGGSAHFV